MEYVSLGLEKFHWVVTAVDLNFWKFSEIHATSWLLWHSNLTKFNFAPAGEAYSVPPYS